MKVNIKKILFAILIFSSLLNCSTHSNNNFFHKRIFFIGPFQRIQLDERIIKYYEDGPVVKVIFNGEYKLIKENVFTIMNIKDNNFIVFYLLDTIILVNKNNGEIIIGADYDVFGKSASMEPTIYNFQNIKSDSFITEGSVQYASSNLEKSLYNPPWAVHDGIGTKLYFDFFDDTNNIIIANGFFNPKNLNLYEENNRVKKIKIKLLDSNYEQVSDLEDTYNLQMIKLPKKSKKFEITILDVYKGTKYPDTCISGLFTNYSLSLKEK